MDIKKFKNMLRDGEVRFVFTKKDGSERVARGTLNLNIVPSESHPKGEGRPSPEDMVKYFDLDKQAWRSFRWSQFVEVR